MKADRVPHTNIAQLSLITVPDAMEIPVADSIHSTTTFPSGYEPGQGVPREINIERLIWHKTDHRAGRTEYADDFTEYTDDGRKLITEHIQKVIGESQWNARFEHHDGPIPELCARLLGTDDEFIDSSRELARRLYESMFTKRITRGDFVAAIYTHGDETLRRIAIFKFDIETRLVRDVDHAGEKTRINIKENDGVLPTAENSRFTKCALLTPTKMHDSDDDPVLRFQIKLLDAQAGPRSDGIAAFFCHRFLNAKLEPNERRHTHEFLEVTDKFISKTDLAGEDRDAFYIARRDVLLPALASDSLEIDIDQFVKEALPNRVDLQAELESELAHAILTTATPAERTARCFSVDVGVARPFVHKVILELDGGSRLSFPTEAYNEMVTIEKVPNENRYRITILTHSYHEVIQR